MTPISTSTLITFVSDTLGLGVLSYISLIQEMFGFILIFMFISSVFWLIWRFVKIR